MRRYARLSLLRGADSALPTRACSQTDTPRASTHVGTHVHMYSSTQQSFGIDFARQNHDPRYWRPIARLNLSIFRTHRHTSTNRTSAASKARVTSLSPARIISCNTAAHGSADLRVSPPPLFPASISCRSSDSDPPPPSRPACSPCSLRRRLRAVRRCMRAVRRRSLFKLRSGSSTWLSH